MPGAASDVGMSGGRAHGAAGGARAMIRLSIQARQALAKLTLPVLIARRSA